MKTVFNALALSCILLLPQAYCQDTSPFPTLTVRGHASLTKPADQLLLSIGVVTNKRTAQDALTENSGDMRDIIHNLQSSGLSDQEFSTGQFSIQPIYTQRPQNSPSDWQAQIIAYEVTNTLHIKTDKVNLAGEIIDSVTAAGANTIDSIRFVLKDPLIYRAEAIAAATANAIADANALSKAAKVNIRRVFSVNLDDAQVNCPIARVPYLAKSMASSTPIEAGDVEVSASVTLTYEVD